jgi:hypothetical protein
MNKLTLVAALLLCPSVWAATQNLPSVRFEHKDWELSCDNTRTCRAAGYHKDEDENPISVLLTREAGPGQPVKVEVQLGDDPETRNTVPGQLRMKIGGRDVGTVKIDRKTHIGELSAAQVAALLPALLKDAPIAWADGKDEWRLSSAGANAVLLKMDEFQGRLGTPGALVRRGTQAENQVLPALPAPVLTAVLPASGKADKPTLPARQQAVLVDALRKVTPVDECELLGPDQTDPIPLETYPLTNDRMLVQRECWHAAYNSGSGYWVARRQPPYAPVLVTTSANEYDKGTIYSAQRGRGVGDCMSNDSWTWDGQSFVHTASSTSGMCKQIAAGGAWDLPTLVTTIKKQP